jgi:hypothetical protein
LRNRLKVYGTMGEKLTITPINAAAATCQPVYRMEDSSSIGESLA